jgi:V/A-type H+-transporting ATPase subunit A
LKLVKLMVNFHKDAQRALKEGASLADIRAMPVIPTLLKAKFEIPDDQVNKLNNISKDMSDQFHKVIGHEEVKVVV